MRFYGDVCFAVLGAIGLYGSASDNPSGPAMGGARLGGSSDVSTAGSPGMSGVAGSETSGSSSGGGNLAGGGDTGLGGSGGGGSGQAAAGAAGTPGGGTDGGSADPHPLSAVLAKFTAPYVPARGPMEAAPNPRNCNGAVPTPPGSGISQHPLLYVGENYNRISMTNQGKLIWTYDTQGGFELDDVRLLSNGNVPYSHMTYIEEITPSKQVVWHYDPPAGSEIHTCQPIGLDKVMLGMESGPQSEDHDHQPPRRRSSWSMSCPMAGACPFMASCAACG